MGLHLIEIADIRVVAIVVVAHRMERMGGKRSQ